jgi:hypothetical protein
MGGKIFTQLAVAGVIGLGTLAAPVQASGMFDWMSPGKWFNSRDYDRDYYRSYPGWNGYGYPGGWGGYGYPPVVGGYGYPGWGGYGYPVVGGYPVQQQNNNTPAPPPTPQ